MTDADDTKRILDEWAAALVEELGLTGAEVDVDGILRLAGIAAHSVIRPAAPVTTYIVGYAAGLAAGAAAGGSDEPGASAPSASVPSASVRAEALARRFGESAP